MLRSIRWTLQIWHAAILLLVLLGFGSASYYEVSRTRFMEVDAELSGTVHLLAAYMIPPPRRPAPPPPRREDAPLGPPGASGAVGVLGQVGVPGGPEGRDRPRPGDPLRRFDSLPPDQRPPDQRRAMRIRPTSAHRRTSTTGPASAGTGPAARKAGRPSARLRSAGRSRWRAD